MDNAAPRIAVIVATRNRPDDLARLLDSVLELDHDAFEVVVADQSEVPHELVDDPRFVHLRLASIGKSAGLNRASRRRRRRSSRSPTTTAPSRPTG